MTKRSGPNLTDAHRAKRRSGPGGKNQLTEVKLRAEDDEIDAWTRAAAKSGTDRNSWLRAAANQMADDVLGDDDES